MVSAEHTVVINKPVEDVFAFVADLANEPKYHTDVVQVTPTSPVELGSTVTLLTKAMGRKGTYTAEVTGLEPNRRIELTGRAGLMKPTLTHRFEPVDSGTRYTRHVDIPLEGMYRFMEPLMRRMAQKRQVRFAENLKKLLEA